MKTVNKTIAGLAALLFAGSASAGLLNGGISIHVAQIFEYASTDTNGNGVVDVVGEVLGGMGNVQSITSAGGDVLWVNGTGGNELTFVFDGYTAHAINGPLGMAGTFEVLFSGGNVDFYLDGAQNFNAAGGPTAANLGTASDGLLWMALLGVSGILPDGVTSLFSTLTALTTPFVGSGFGHLELDLGNLGATGTFYDNDGVIGASGETNDFLLESSFNATEGQNAGWPAGGTASITGVPEPASIALMGLGLLGMGFAARKRS